MVSPVAALRSPALRVSTRAPIGWAVGAVLRSIIGAGILLLVTGPWDWFTMPAWGWVVYALVAVGYCAVMPVWRYRIHRWETTEGAVYTQSGWWTVERRVAPLSRVQTVDVSQGPISRVLRIASVTVTTASARGPASISGLDRRVADDLVAELTRRTEGQVGDAT